MRLTPSFHINVRYAGEAKFLVIYIYISLCPRLCLLAILLYNVHRLTLKTDAVFPPTSTSRGAARGGSDYLTVAGCPTGVHSCGALLSVLYRNVMLCEHRILIHLFIVNV